MVSIHFSCHRQAGCFLSAVISVARKQESRHLDNCLTVCQFVHVCVQWYKSWILQQFNYYFLSIILYIFCSGLFHFSFLPMMFKNPVRLHPSSYYYLYSSWELLFLLDWGAIFPWVYLIASEVDNCFMYLLCVFFFFLEKGVFPVGG